MTGGQRVAGYLLLALLFTWPLPMSLATRCWGHQWDLWGNLWAMDLIGRGEAAPFLPRLFFPVGFDMVADVGHFLIPCLGGGLAKLIPPALAYNLLLLTLLVATCLAAHQFAARLGAGPGGCMAAAAVFAFNPYVFSQMAIGSIEMLALPGMAILAACLVASESERATGWYVVGFFALVGTFLANVPYGVIAFLLVGMFIFYRLPMRRVALGWTACAVLVAVALSPYVQLLVARLDNTPPAHPGPWAEVTRNWKKWDEVYFGRRTMLDFSKNDAGAWAAHDIVACSVTPGDFYHLRPPLFPAAGAPFWILLLPLWVVGFRGSGKFWALAAAVFLALSLGPKGPLYPFLYDFVPHFHGMHRPYVFLSGAWLCLAGLVALIAGRLALSTAAGAALAVGLVIAVRLLSPDAAEAAMVTVPDDPPAAYQWLAGREGDFAVVEIPFMPLPMSASNARAQFWQRAHHKKLFNAMLLRPAMWLDFNRFVHAQPLLLEIARLQEGAPPGRALPRDAVELLGQAGFRYILVRRAYDHESMIVENLRNALYSRNITDLLTSLLGKPEMVGDAWIYDLRKRGSGRRPAAAVEVVTEVTRVPPEGLLTVLPSQGPLREMTFWVEGQGPLRVTVQDSGGRLLVSGTLQARPNHWNAVRIPLQGPAALVGLKPSGAARIARMEVTEGNESPTPSKIVGQSRREGEPRRRGESDNRGPDARRSPHLLEPGHGCRDGRFTHPRAPAHRTPGRAGRHPCVRARRRGGGAARAGGGRRVPRAGGFPRRGTPLPGGFAASSTGRQPALRRL
ncbi:MAG: hypothetical protein FJX76_25815 [Armatimonadetes bacterium]|nr:hypothetical protein [Armatimonadota bacterium]